MSEDFTVKMTVGGVKIGAAPFTDVHAAGLRVHDGMLIAGQVTPNAWGSERIAKYHRDCRRHKVVKALRLLRVPRLLLDIVGPRFEPPANRVTLYGSYVTGCEIAMQVPV